MAGSSFFALVDDIASLLDDVSLMTKVAARKTAGVLGDDLALNAQQVSGVRADRELPVVWAVARGSLLNKAILVPAALLVSALAPWAVRPLLMVGGAYLCYEGVEKLAHRWLHGRDEGARHHAELLRAVQDEQVDMLAYERDKVKGAIRTDFILSAEIIVISLGTLPASASLVDRLLVLALVALVMTVGVYGVVAAIVKLDDLGVLLQRGQGAGPLARLRRATGTLLLRGAPWLMKLLSVLGTAAMFLVGGGILVHAIAPLHHWIEAHAQGFGGGIAAMAANAAVGIAAGALVLAVVTPIARWRSRRTAAP